MQNLIKSYTDNFFLSIVFDANKYKNHHDAFKNNDFKYIDQPEQYILSSDIHGIQLDTINSINQLSHSNFKLAVPFFKFDILQLNYFSDNYEDFYSNVFEDHIADHHEYKTIANFILYLLSTNKNMNVIKDNLTQSFNFQNFLDSFNKQHHIVDLFKLDFQGYVNIQGKPLSFFFDNLVVNQTHDINSIFNAINLDIF
jgi:hypothetical protein